MENINNKNYYKVLEYDVILQKLADKALSETVKERCLELKPELNLSQVIRKIDETTQAKCIIEQNGTPPVATMTELNKVLSLISIEAILTTEQIGYVLSFLKSCRRMKLYLKKAETTGNNIALFGDAINDLDAVEEEIERCIKNGMVDDRASQLLAEIRRKISFGGDQIKVKLEALLRKNRAWFSESFVSVRNGYFTLPVKSEYKNNVSGTVVDMSQTGSTCFIEPTAVSKLHEELSILYMEEDNEVRRILYCLTAIIDEYLPQIKINIEAMETLDFLFAKAKLSLEMKASSVAISNVRRISIKNARHPLLKQETAVPLDFIIGDNIRGVIITGPNTGGKTVALKTVGLLSLMVQSGLHVPADENSSFCMNNLILCDIGDGQSISENLSTFSSHMTNIIEILRVSCNESLILLDELGSGTDPAEGMGLAIAILEELCQKGCLFVATTHYPEVKEFALKKPGLINARMAFDKESLMPLYRLEIGEAGESCALYIAERLGMNNRILQRAKAAAYGDLENMASIEDNLTETMIAAPRLLMQDNSKKIIQKRCDRFNIGDSIMVYPQKEIGIVYSRANEKGEVGVQVKGKKKLINHKRIKLQIAASELYPDDYDFSIIFDSVANRKAHHLMGKRHEEGNIAIINEGIRED